LSTNVHCVHWLSTEQTKLLDEIDETLKVAGFGAPPLHDGHLLESMSRLGTG